MTRTKVSSFKQFTAQDFDLNPETVTIGAKIGAGSFSQVYKGIYLASQQPVAIKCQMRDQDEEEIPTYIWRELTVLSRIRHPHIVTYIGAWQQMVEKKVWIVTEYLPGGDLRALIKRGDAECPLSWQLRARMAYDTAVGMAYLHDQKFIHRDIKAANVVLTEDFRCKLCDFGFAREIPSTTLSGVDRRMSVCGTDSHMAPELYFDEDYNTLADVFSFGMALIELITRKQVNHAGFMMRLPNNNFQLDVEEFRANVPEDCPLSLKLLAESCIAFESEERISSTEVAEWLEELCQDLEVQSIEPDELPALPSIPEPCPETNDDEISEKMDTLDKKAEGVDTETLDDGEMECPARAGYLFRRISEQQKCWKRRWVVLNGPELNTFSSCQSALKKKAKGKIQKGHNHLSLKDCHLKRETKYKFQLKLSNNLSPYEFTASSEEEADEWVEMIERGIRYAAQGAC